ncbi:MAG TPA: hypothetical protein VGK20_19205 [Candidatus Binatia bacterium]|jgi:hypothetical protein
MIRTILIFGTLVGLSGCPVYHLNDLPESQSVDQPVLFNRPGSLVHEASGLKFAEWYDHFQRVTAYQYDTLGTNVGIGYNDRRPECLIVATFYLYPTPPMSFIGASPNAVASIEGNWLEQEFARGMAAIEKYHPTLESPVIAASTTPVVGTVLRGSSFTFHESGEFSELRLFVYRHQWFLKFRFTYPDSCSAEAESRLEALVANLPWAVAQ